MKQDKPYNESRRQFCKVCIGAMSAVAAAMVGYPVIGFMQLPERLDASKPLEVPLDRLTVGQAQYGEFRGQQVIVLLTSDGPKVFSASCPHLGCNVMWDSGDSMFHCPCHGAVFNGAGEVVRGPVSRPLSKVPFEIKDGKVILS